MFQNTTLIITSDHGGIGFGHGGESMTELEVPWNCWSRNKKKCTS